MAVPEEKKYSAYVIVSTSKEEVPRGFELYTSEDAARKSFATAIAESTQENSASSSKSKEDSGNTETNAEKGHDNSLSSIMKRAIDAIHSQSELVTATKFLIPFAHTFFLDRMLCDPARENGTLIESMERASLLGLNEDGFRKISPELERYKRLGRGLDALPTALLMSIVATFDSTTADIIRVMFNLKSNFIQNGTKTVLFSDVVKAASIDQIRERVISEEIYIFSRGSHEEQVQFIERVFHVNIREHWKRWPDFIEVFERRNLVAHGEKNFTERYVSICKKQGHRGCDKVLHTPILLSNKYLVQSLEIMLEFVVLLIFSLWRKHFPDQENEAFQAVNHATFQLIADKGYVVPIRVLEHVRSLKNTHASDLVQRMMIVNLASAYKHQGNENKCRETLGSVDWSATSENYKICVAALKDEVDEVCRLMPLAATTGSVSKGDFRQWPVFDSLRGSEEFKRKYKEVFGEDITAESPAAAGPVQEDANSPKNDAASSNTDGANDKSSSASEGTIH